MTIEEMAKKYREGLKKEGIYTDKVIDLMVGAYLKGCLNFYAEKVVNKSK